MRSITEKKIFSTINVRLPIFVLAGLILATGICGYYYYKGASATKSTALFGGFVTGLILVTIQFLFNWAEYKSISKMQAWGIKDMLLHRDDREFYQRLIKQASRRIDVMGVTASRFIAHFADQQGNRPETKVLLEALSRGVQVRILVPAEGYLHSEAERVMAITTTSEFEHLARAYENFHYNYFNHEPMHSIVVVDDIAILGPVFPGMPSRHTPAIFITTESEYTRKYLDYFEREWGESHRTDQATH